MFVENTISVFYKMFVGYTIFVDYKMCGAYTISVDLKIYVEISVDHRILRQKYLCDSHRLSR